LQLTVLVDTPTEGDGRFHRASWLMCLPHYQHLWLGSYWATQRNRHDLYCRTRIATQISLTAAHPGSTAAHPGKAREPCHSGNKKHTRGADTSPQRLAPPWSVKNCTFQILHTGSHDV